MEQTAPKYTPLRHSGDDITANTVLRSLGVSPSDLLDGLEPTVINTGNTFLIVPLRDAETVRTVVPDHPTIQAVSERLGLIGYYVFSLETQVQGRDAGARMFAPLYGIAEEAATGMAAGPLACYLYEYLDVKKPTLIIEQGHLMSPASPSVLTARLNIDGEAISSLMVGGRAQASRTVEVALR